MVCALVRLSALLLPALLLLSLLVRLSASRCVWLLSPVGRAVRCRFLPGLLLSLLLMAETPPALRLSLLGAALPCSRPLLVVLWWWWLSFPRLVPRALSLACCALLPRARVGPRRPPARGFGPLLSLPGWARLLLPRSRRSRGLAIRARPQTFRAAMQLPSPCRQGSRR